MMKSLSKPLLLVDVEVANKIIRTQYASSRLIIVKGKQSSTDSAGPIYLMT
ncbi:Uncharacterised protein [BD1-7 clade bacterium]|uniref:Uncharacterized protein n=1 Tax=BD1-7 clade bacterium TaxID=2029982 RepID=A0A5S9Q4F5_9GAMM|nr:Uncharacterised protein [BD1-7 clade bacterium]CAA0112524.1 Uncharacterised protein [BD1-7 clade bacterium]